MQTMQVRRLGPSYAMCMGHFSCVDRLERSSKLTSLNIEAPSCVSLCIMVVLPLNSILELHSSLLSTSTMQKPLISADYITVKPENINASQAADEL